MKKALFTSFAATLVIIAACRKEEPVELPQNGVIIESHCGNGVLDGDEDGVDCGPSCGPCAQFTADCGGVQPIDDTFTTTNGANLDFTTGTVVSDTSSGVLVIKGTVGSSFVTATFGTATPSPFQFYEVVQNLPSPTEVRLVYYNGSTYYTGYTDEIVLNRLNGKFNFEFCDVYMSIASGGYTIGKGKLIED